MDQETTKIVLYTILAIGGLVFLRHFKTILLFTLAFLWGALRAFAVIVFVCAAIYVGYQFAVGG